VADGRVTLSRIFPRSAESHSLVYGHIIADLSCLAYYYPHSVVNKTSPADGSSRMDLYSCKPPGELGYYPCQQFNVVLIQPVGRPVHYQRPNARIADEDLKAVSGS